MSDRPNEDKKLHDPKATVQLTADDLAAMRAELQQEKDKANQFATARLSEADIAPATNKKLENPYATVQLNPEEMAALRAEAQRVKAEAQAAQAAQAAPAPDNVSSMRGGAVANTPPAPAAPQSFPDQTVIMSPGQARAQYGNSPVDQSYAPPAQQQQYAPPQQQQYAPPAQQQYAPPQQQYAPPAQQQYAPPQQPGYGQNYQHVQQNYNPPVQTGFSAPPAPLNTNENFFQKYGVYLLIGFGAMLIVAAILLLVIG